MYCFVVIDCYLPSTGRARMSLSSPKSLMLSWSVSSRKKYPCLTARWTSKQRPRHASSTRSDRMSWARPWQGRKQADTVMQQPSHLMCICKASEKTLASLYSTSSLLLSRPDIATSSIFICQHYQMSSHCCGHAAEKEASAKTGLQQKGEAFSQQHWHHTATGEINCKTLNDAATHNNTLNATTETLPTFTTCGTAEKEETDCLWRNIPFAHFSYNHHAGPNMTV